ncbi:hypothetical protein RFI_00053, partial [Reticulomyxa filosa]
REKKKKGCSTGRPKKKKKIIIIVLQWQNIQLKKNETVSKPCQVRRKILHKKKGITLYLFNDLLVLVSTRGKYKGGYSLYNKDFQIEKTGKPTDAEFSVGLSFEKTKRVLTFANDELRDAVMEKIVDAFRKCQERANAASFRVFFVCLFVCLYVLFETNEIINKEDLYHDMAKKETQTPLEISQSSTEHSVSISQPEPDTRAPPPKPSTFSPQPPVCFFFFLKKRLPLPFFFLKKI